MFLPPEERQCPPRYPQGGHCAFQGFPENQACPMATADSTGSRGGTAP